MKTYTVRINCTNYQDIEVEAKNKKEAIEEALLKFNCSGSEGEFCELIRD